LAIVSPTVTITGLATATQDSTTVNGSGIANSDATDAVQAYQGGAPASPQNFFSRYAPGNPPLSPSGNFTRGDVIAGSPLGGSRSVVAESYLDTALAGAPASETASSSQTTSFSFTLPSSSAVSIGYNFSNDLFTFNNGSGAQASADYHFDLTLKDAAGNIVFNASTSSTNLSSTAPPGGVEIIRSGTETLTTPVLTGNATYTVIASSTATTSIVPEPSSILLLIVGCTLALAARWRKSDVTV
jgi:hypothetical protein